MGERPSHIPREELERSEGLILPPDRPKGHYAVGDRVVVFAPLREHLKGLKRGTLDHFSDDGRCVFIDLEVKISSPMRGAAQPLHGSRSAEEKSFYLVRFNEAALMSEREFEILCGNTGRIREWLQGAPDGRQKATLRRALENGSTIEEASAANLSPQALAQNLLR